MSDALKQLQDNIEAIRREAHASGYGEGFAVGYARAIQDLAGLVAKMSPPDDHSEKLTITAPRTTRRSTLPARSPRGENRARILEVLRRIRHPLGITPIQRELQGQGTDVAYSSVRHALTQLALLDLVMETPEGWKIKEASAGIPTEAF